MGKTKMEQQFEMYDAVADSIQEGMVFNVKKKVKTQEEEGISIQGIKFKRGMKFELQRDFKLKKKDIRENDGIDMEGGKKFHFHEDDIIEIDSVEVGEVHTIKFHVERKRKPVKNNEEKKVVFTMGMEEFLELFESYADVEIAMFPHFRFKQGDSIIIKEVNSFPLKEGEEKQRKEVSFLVKRDGEILEDNMGRELVFTFNASIFVQRFEQSTDVTDVVSEASEKVRGLLSREEN